MMLTKKMLLKIATVSLMLTMLAMQAMAQAPNPNSFDWLNYQEYNDTVNIGTDQQTRRVNISGALRVTENGYVFEVSDSVFDIGIAYLSGVGFSKDTNLVGVLNVLGRTESLAGRFEGGAFQGLTVSNEKTQLLSQLHPLLLFTSDSEYVHMQSPYLLMDDISSNNNIIIEHRKITGLIPDSLQRSIFIHDFSDSLSFSHDPSKLEDIVSMGEGICPGCEHMQWSVLIGQNIQVNRKNDSIVNSVVIGVDAFASGQFVDNSVAIGGGAGGSDDNPTSNFSTMVGTTTGTDYKYLQESYFFGSATNPTEGIDTAYRVIKIGTGIERDTTGGVRNDTLTLGIGYNIDFTNPHQIVIGSGQDPYKEFWLSGGGEFSSFIADSFSIGVSSPPEGTDADAKPFDIVAARGTGAGDPGVIRFKAPTVEASGTTRQTNNVKMTISGVTVNVDVPYDSTGLSPNDLYQTTAGELRIKQ